MDEVWARAGLVAGALAVAGVVVLIQRSRARQTVRRVAATGLEPGVYLFTSTTCSSCIRARETLEAGLGEGRFRELAWEEASQTFEELGVDAVPAVMVVDGRGRGRIYPGQPDRALRRLSSAWILD